MHVCALFLVVQSCVPLYLVSNILAPHCSSVFFIGPSPLVPPLPPNQNDNNIHHKIVHGFFFFVVFESLFKVTNLVSLVSDLDIPAPFFSTTLRAKS